VAAVGHRLAQWLTTVGPTLSAFYDVVEHIDVDQEHHAHPRRQIQHRQGRIRPLLGRIWSEARSALPLAESRGSRPDPTANEKRKRRKKEKEKRKQEEESLLWICRKGGEELPRDGYLGFGLEREVGKSGGLEGRPVNGSGSGSGSGQVVSD